VLAVAPPDRLAGHFHDTNGRALESVAVSMEKGLRVFDSAVGGLGGCPYAPGAKGNLSTGSLARDLAVKGVATGLDHAALTRAEQFVINIRGLLE